MEESTDIQPASPAPRPWRILLVEDHEDTRFVLQLALRRKGYEVAAASTKADAMDLCQRQNFDLLIGDLKLPDGSGLDLMRDLGKICNIKGIAYTGYGYEKDIADARDAGFSAHLLKPANLDEFFATIERVLKETRS